jgi:hypothetical protein
MSATQLAADAATKAGSAAKKVEKLTLALAVHLRIEHGLSRRETAQRVGWTQSEVRRYVDEPYR